jgi:hypothetical protein
MEYVWFGQSKGIGKWKEFEDGDLISAKEAEGDPRFKKWMKAGVLKSKKAVDAEAKKKADAILRVAENRAKKAAEAEKAKGK